MIVFKRRCSEYSESLLRSERSNALRGSSQRDQRQKLSILSPQRASIQVNTVKEKRVKFKYMKNPREILKLTLSEDLFESP